MTELSMTAQQVAGLLGGRVEGDGETPIKSLATIDKAKAGDATFALDARRAKKLASCEASVVIVPAELGAIEGKTSILVEDPATAVAATLTIMAGPEYSPASGVHESAVVADDAKLGKNVCIGANVTICSGAEIGDSAIISENAFIGPKVKIGAETLIMQGVVIRENCVVGCRCRINPNAVIGSDGFGYFTREGVHHRIPHAGNVIIGDDVDLGACVCIDRGKFDATVIGPGSKIDNQVQIGHGAKLGQGVIMAGQSGVAGSATLGNYVVMGGNSGVRDNIEIGDGVQIAAYSAAAKSLEAGQTVGSGIPAMPSSQYMRMVRVIPQLPEMKRTLNKLVEKIQQLEDKLSDS